MTFPLFHLLAQIDPSKVETAAPALTVDASSAMTWTIAAILVVGILLITFKTSKRNHVIAE